MCRPLSNFVFLIPMWVLLHSTGKVELRKQPLFSMQSGWVDASVQTSVGCRSATFLWCTTVRYWIESIGAPFLLLFCKSGVFTEATALRSGVEAIYATPTLLMCGVYHVRLVCFSWAPFSLWHKHFDIVASRFNLDNTACNYHFMVGYLII